MYILKLIFLFFLLLGSSVSTAQLDPAFFQALHSFDMPSLKKYKATKPFEEASLLGLLEDVINYIDFGIKNEKINLQEVIKTPESLLLYTHYLTISGIRYEPDLHQALLEAFNKNSPLLDKEIGLALCNYLSYFSPRQSIVIPDVEKYLYSIIKSRFTDLDWFRYKQIEIDLLSQKLESDQLLEPNQDLKMKYDEQYRQCPENNYLKGIMEKNLGIYYEVFEQDYQQAEKYFKKASTYFSKMSNFFGERHYLFNQNSLGIVFQKTGKHKEALKIFRALIKEKVIHDHPEAYLFINQRLEECYIALDNPQQAHYHATVVNRLQDSIHRLRQTEAILEKNFDQRLAEKEQKIDQAKAKERTLYQWFLFLIPILGMALLIIFLLFRIYKQSRKEVKKITQMVIKNHIVLKDKTKVYINDLMYIKAEDHYIRVYTSDGKNHLVRGKLSDLETQLPPNFLRTQRSYITNRNYVKQVQRQFLILINGTQIPISRKHQRDWT